MSDPVTNVEIEDVLSSIRRLVSDDIRVIKPKPEAVKQPDRLVLTPALRVSEESHEGGESLKAPVVLSEVSLDVEDDQVEETAEEFSENLIDIAAVERAILPETDDVPASGLNDDTLAQSDLVSEALDDFVKQQVVRALSVTDLDAEDDTDLDDVSVAGEADADREELVLQSLVADLATPDNAPVLEEVAENLPADAETSLSELVLEIQDETSDDDVGDGHAVSDGESLADKIAALEEMVGRTQATDLEPEQPVSEAPVFHRSSDVMDWQDHVPVPDEHAQDEKDEQDDVRLVTDHVQNDIQPEVESPQPEQTKVTDAAQDAAMIDEDTLRALVSDMVRQELQGALGERITRNVRKLVRREIHRVLISQDFD